MRKRALPSATRQRPERHNLHFLLAIGVPLLFGLALAIEPAIRVANRVDDGDYRARLIPGNGVALTWAPAGPGWAVSVRVLVQQPPPQLGKTFHAAYTRFISPARDAHVFSTFRKEK